MGNEKGLELVSNFGCSGCNWMPRSGIKKTERLAEEVRFKEQYRAFAKSNVAWNCKNCKASPRDLRLLGATFSLGNIPENRDKHNNNNHNNNNNNTKSLLTVCCKLKIGWANKANLNI